MRTRLLLLNVAVAGTALLVALGIGEAVLRALVERPLPRVLPEVRYAPHPVRRFTLRASQEAFTYGAPARIDASGFRVNGETEPRTPSDLRVLALGDSFTFGLGVANDRTWPALLESRLRARLGPGVQVVNAGTISYGVFQELDLLRNEGMATRPHVVVHALYWNDFMNADAPPPGAPPVLDANGYFTWDRLSERRSIVSRSLSTSALVYTAREAFTALGAAGGPATGYAHAYSRFLASGLSDSEWRPIAAFYREFKQLAADRGFAPFVAVMPVSHLVTRRTARTHPYRVAARRMLEAHDLPYVDTFTLWDDANSNVDVFMRQRADAHLSAAGYALLAHGVDEALAEEPGFVAAANRYNDAQAERR